MFSPLPGAGFILAQTLPSFFIHKISSKNYQKIAKSREIGLLPGTKKSLFNMKVSGLLHLANPRHPGIDAVLNHLLENRVLFVLQYLSQSGEAGNKFVLVDSWHLLRAV